VTPLRMPDWTFTRPLLGRGALISVAGDLGLSDCLDALPPRLSGGETRRAELALAVVRRPKCLLAD